MNNIDTRYKIIIDDLSEKERQKYPNEFLQVVFIKNGVYAVEFKSGNIGYFIDDKGELIISVSDLSKMSGYNELLEQLGFLEEKVGEEYILKNKLTGTKIDKYSLEYFNLFSDVNFIFSYDLNKSFLDELSSEQLLLIIPVFIKSGSFRIKNLEYYFLSGKITKNYFDEKLKILVDLIELQSKDERGLFRSLNDLVSKQEIQKYFNKGYINEILANKCIDFINERDAILQGARIVLQNTHINLDSLKSAFM